MRKLETAHAHLIRNERSRLGKIVFVALIFTALFLASTLSAHAADLRAEITTPVAISGQIFDGGRVELVSSGQSNLKALLIDGQEVALVFRHTIDRLPQSAHADFLVRLDAQGVSHLIGITWKSAHTGRSEQRLFRIAVVAPTKQFAIASLRH